MKTRTKFKCTEIGKRTGWGQDLFLYSAKFSATAAGMDNDENKEFFAATPSGSIEVSTVKGDHFEVGKNYYVDFTPAN